jgi:ATP-dependent RNA helicase DeaD
MLSNNLSIQHALLHGDIDQRQRLSRLKQFKEHKVQVLIATDVAARGLDIANVEVIINF